MTRPARSELGGDWDLEFELGLLETSVAVDTAAQGQFASLLDLCHRGRHCYRTDHCEHTARLRDQRRADRCGAWISWPAAAATPCGSPTVTRSSVCRTRPAAMPCASTCAAPMTIRAASGENLLEAKSNYLVGAEDQWRAGRGQLRCRALRRDLRRHRPALLRQPAAARVRLPGQGRRRCRARSGSTSRVHRAFPSTQTAISS